MDHKKTGYFFLLVILFIGQLFGFVLAQYILYDIYFNQIYSHEIYQLLLLPMVLYSIIGFFFAIVLDLILNQKVLQTKVVLLGLLFPITLIYEAGNIPYAVIASLVSFLSLAYWYFFTFYWKKRRLKETLGSQWSP